MIADSPLFHLAFSGFTPVDIGGRAAGGVEQNRMPFLMQKVDLGDALGEAP